VRRVQPSTVPVPDQADKVCQALRGVPMTLFVCIVVNQHEQPASTLTAFSGGVTSDYNDFCCGSIAHGDAQQPLRRRHSRGARKSTTPRDPPALASSASISLQTSTGCAIDRGRGHLLGRVQDVGGQRLLHAAVSSVAHTGSISGRAAEFLPPPRKLGDHPEISAVLKTLEPGNELGSGVLPAKPERRTLQRPQVQPSE